MLASHALVLLGVPLRRVVHKVQSAREARYESLRGFFHGVSDATDDAETMQIRLHTVELNARVKAVGKSLADTMVNCKLDELGVDVTAIRRGKTRIDPKVEVTLEGGDILVIRGTAEGVAKAEQRLLR
jgi:monovalent cation:H+ antiporter-2, CPA2 family